MLNIDLDTFFFLLISEAFLTALMFCRHEISTFLGNSNQAVFHVVGLYDGMVIMAR